MKRTIDNIESWITLDMAKAAAKKYLPDCRLKTCIKHYIIFCGLVIKSENGKNKELYRAHLSLLSLLSVSNMRLN